MTLHSGEGKANQYLMRGYNLDHGTDLETYVDGMPINQPTHAHGQGYTDLNFMIPELADDDHATPRGPTTPMSAISAPSARCRSTIATPSRIRSSATVGTLGFQRLFAAGTQPLGDGQLLAAAELQHYDGPFTTPDDARKENAVLRYSEGDEHNGYSVTGMFYHQLWTNTTDIPLRAIDRRPGPRSLRHARSDRRRPRAARQPVVCNITHRWAAGNSRPAPIFIYNQLHLFNDFTHFLVDPVHGDQEDQFENRRVVGGAANYTLPVSPRTDSTTRFAARRAHALRHAGCRAPAQRGSGAADAAAD